MKKNMIYVVILMPLLYLVNFFVPIMNPMIVSVNNLNPQYSLWDCLVNTDQIIEPIKGIAGQQMVSFFIPMITLVFIIGMIASIIGMVLAFASERTRGRGIKYIMNATIVMGLIALFEIGFFLVSTMSGTATLQFPIGAVVLLLIAGVHLASIILYKKAVKKADTRARYMRNIFTPTQKREAKHFYIMVSVFYLMAILIYIAPFVWGMTYSFTNYTGFNLESTQSVGFNNYIRVFNDPQTFSSLMTTIEISLFTVPAGLVLGVALAMLLNTNIKGSGFFRTIYYFPSIIPAVGVGIMWRLMFAQNGGVINSALAVFGVDPVNWLGIDHCREALYIMILWGAAGGILTYLSALKAISNELYESASIDGANAFQKFYKITLPMISSTIFYNLVTGIIAAWQIMEQPVFLAGATLLAVPLQPNYTFLVHVFQQIFTNQRFGFGLAMIWVLFFASMILNRVVFWTGDFWVFNENAPDKPKKVKKQKQAKAIAAN